jgi:hypothetical protein
MMARPRGQSLVEGTLVMLLFFALLLGVVDCGQLIFAHQALVERARAAARWGSLHPEAGPEPVRNLLLYGTPEPGLSRFPGVVEENVHVSFREEDGVPALHVEVVNFEAPLFAPWWAGLPHRWINPRPVSLTVPVAAAR